MYDADPFAARKEVDERQAKAAKKRDEMNAASSSRNPPTSGEYAQAPEVKMASGLRELVEDAVKKVWTMNSSRNAALTPAFRLVPCTPKQKVGSHLCSAKKMRPRQSSNLDTLDSRPLKLETR